MRSARRRLALVVPFFADAGSFFSGSAFTALFGFLFWTLMARRFPPHDIGLASAYQNALIAAATLAHLGLGIAFVRQAPQALPIEERRALSRTVFGLSMVSGFVVGFAVARLAGLLVTQLSLLLDWRSTVAFAAIAVAWTWFQPFILDHVLLGIGARRWIPGKAAISFVVRASLPFALAVSLSGFNAIVLGIVASVVIADLVTMTRAVPLFGRPTLRRRPVTWNQFPQLLRDARPLYVSSLLWQGMTPLLPLIAIEAGGLAVGAVFYFAWMLVSMVNFVGVAAATALFARGSREDLKALEIAIVAGTAVVLQAAALGLLAIVGPPILSIVGRPYGQAMTFVWQLAPGPFAATVSVVFQSLFRISRRYRALVVVSACPMAAVLAWVLLTGLSGGVAGIAHAWVGGVVLSMVLAILLFAAPPVKRPVPGEQ